jgi:hypothetical protein
MSNDNVNGTTGDGGAEGSNVEIHEPGGTRRPLNASEAALYRDAISKKWGVSTKSDAEALDEAVKRDNEARAKEEAAKQKGKESWDRLEEETRDDGQQPDAPTELSVPEETPKEHVERIAGFMEDLAPITRELNLPVGDVQDVVEFAVSLAVADRAADLDNPQACVTVMEHLHGRTETEKIIADARDACDRLGVKMKQWLDATGLGNDPSVLYALAAWNRGDLRMSPERAQAELDKLTRDPKSAYRNANAIGHKGAVARANMLYRVLSKGEAKKSAEPAISKPKTPAKSSAKQAQEAELKSLLAHPAYRDRGHRESASVRARIETLYSTHGLSFVMG